MEKMKIELSDMSDVGQKGRSLMKTEKISDRLYPDTIKRIQEIAAEHEQKADVYEALVTTYDLYHMTEIKQLKNVTGPIYKMLTELGKQYVELAKQCEGVIQVEKEQYKTSLQHLNTKILESIENENIKNELLNRKDNYIIELKKQYEDTKLELQKIQDQKDLFEGMRRILKHQGLQQSFFDEEEKTS
jgi:hypothetical protein